MIIKLIKDVRFPGGTLWKKNTVLDVDRQYAEKLIKYKKAIKL